MKKLIIAFAAFVSFATYAGDCPAPKPLTCDQLASKMEARCPKGYIKEFPDCTCPKCPEPTTKIVEVGIPGPKVEVPGPTTIIYMDPPTPKPEGHPFVAFGPAYFHGLGLTVAGGYDFPNGWGLMGQAMYIPQNDDADFDGVARKGCTRIPFTVPGEDAKHSWGGAVLAKYTF